MSRWWRCYDGAPFDPKWRVVSMKIGGRPGDVWAVASALYDHASKNDGSVEDIDLEEIAAGLGYDLDYVTAVTVTLRNRDFFVADRIASWDERQYRDDSTNRVRKFREKKKLNKISDPTKVVTDETLPPFQGNGETPSDADQNRSDSEPPIIPPAGGFDRFWNLYPHQVEEDAARRAFARAEQLAPVGEIIAGLQRYIATKPPATAWMNPAGWLSRKRWTDRPAGTAACKVVQIGLSCPKRPYAEIRAERLAREAAEPPIISSDLEPVGKVADTVRMKIEGAIS